MIAFLMRSLGLSRGLAWLVAGVGILAVLGLVYWFVAARIDDYGDRREADGVAQERAAWVAAGEKLKQDAEMSATRADDRAVERLEKYKEQADEDRKAVDNAVENGTSPLDALFGG